MIVNGTPTRSLWPVADGVALIDQTELPWRLVVRTVRREADMAEAIRCMRVRGAPLIGASAAWGLALAMQEEASDENLAAAVERLVATRPTAVNLRWALDRMQAVLSPLPPAERIAAAAAEATTIAEEDVAQNRAIGAQALALLRKLSPRDGQRLNIMTHCNAGWLATVDYGTALSGLYQAHDAGLPLHVWVSETRPRNQGLLTAWELAQHGIAHTLLADNAAAWLMAEGRVDVVIVGADRIAANGDVANKVGTCLKALAAARHGIPFYVAAPRSTLDFACPDGRHIPIEDRGSAEVCQLAGLDADGHPQLLTQSTAEATNPAFDVTPADLVTALITERGTCTASRDGLATLYPEVSA